jgi:arylsulfatase A-like enzyme
VRKPLLALVAVASSLALTVLVPDLSPLAATRAEAALLRPNVVVLMMDDMTLQELPYLPNVNALLRQRGTSFTNFYVNTPECCPSRATFLTGQYMHNHGVQSGLAPTGGYNKLDHTNALPVWLRNAGYYTAHIGKYMNGIGTVNPLDRPPGWNDYYGLYEPTTYNYFNYDINNNGVAEHHGTADADYQTDVLGERAVKVINGRKGSLQPFFLYFAPLTPHAGTVAGTGLRYPVPAPRYMGARAGLTQPRTPDYNEANVSDKPMFIRNKPALTTQDQANIQHYWRTSIENLLAADEWIGKIVDALGATGQLANTNIIFTSDNGFFHGEHRLRLDKYWPYEVDVHMPLIARGPSFPAGAFVSNHATNVDLTATVLDLAGATAFARRTLDGWSVRPMVSDPLYGSRRDLLFEGGKAWNRTTYEAIRGGAWKYTEYSTGEKELYDLVNDPYELTNRILDPNAAFVRSSLAQRLNVLRSCRGATCTGAP